ncbi:MAG: hypothetical protein LAO79_25900 [Acidobacteriia bacterium]|nr:hypothetical protein [Terriglobia bacterium]
MRTFVMSIGNELRSDDGVAHAIAAQLEVHSCALFQLTPEVAAEVAGYDAVVFIDADVEVENVTLEQVSVAASGSPLTHSTGPSEVVELAKILYGFDGLAFVCRVPANDFKPGQRLGPRALGHMREAAKKLRLLLHDLDRFVVEESGPLANARNGTTRLDSDL